jgi:hypothetical protein
MPHVPKSPDLSVLKLAPAPENVCLTAPQTIGERNAAAEKLQREHPGMDVTVGRAPNALVYRTLTPPKSDLSPAEQTALNAANSSYGHGCDGVTIQMHPKAKGPAP